MHAECISMRMLMDCSVLKSQVGVNAVCTVCFLQAVRLSIFMLTADTCGVAPSDGPFRHITLSLALHSV